MSFHDALFPTDISYGARGGPGFSTAVIGMDSGVEERVARWSRPRRKYDAAYGIKTFEQLQAVRDFYVARYGLLHSFRYRDPHDFSTGPTVTASSYPNGSGHTNLDVLIGTGDGSTTTFQLRKGYASGPSTVYLPLEKIVTGTVLVSIDGVNEPSGWTVNDNTGVLTFGTAPSMGEVIRAGCQFDVEVRFGEELDDHLPMTAEAFSIGSIANIPLVEIISGSTVDEDYMPGGGKKVTFSSDVSVAHVDGRVIVLDPAGAGLTVTIPDATTLDSGGPHFIFVNDGSDDVDLDDGGGVVGTVAAGSYALAMVFVVAGPLNEWRILGP
ncbi:MAG TPA: DUF2460 domain-containing protein [Planctomycetota bacterium]|nr:DUF2460 domain-containing protein [Planctomycetota bacterium]